MIYTEDLNIDLADIDKDMWDSEEVTLRVYYRPKYNEIDMVTQVIDEKECYSSLADYLQSHHLDSLHKELDDVLEEKAEESILP